jgi:hypothetical protein
MWLLARPGIGHVALSDGDTRSIASSTSAQGPPLMPSQHDLGTLRGVPNSEGRNRVQPHQCIQHITVIAAYGPSC